jgi:drug/metabolite transporter (DMT)-like permease
MEDKNWRGHTALLVAYIIFGLNTPVSKTVLDHGGISALALTFYRVAGAALLFWILSLFTRRERVSRRDMLPLFMASLFGVSINQIGFVVGLSLTSPIDASVITTLVPIITMVLAAIFLKEPITWKKVTGVFIGAAGALWLIFQGTTVRLTAGVEGNLLCMLSCVSFAIYLTVYKNLILRYQVTTLMKWMFLLSAICCLPFCWQDVSRVYYPGLSAGLYVRVAFVVVLATFLAYLFIPVGQKLLRPTVVSMYNYLQPLVSSLVAVAAGMDAFGWTKGGAALLIFLGVYVVTQSKSRAQLEMELRQ